MPHRHPIFGLTVAALIGLFFGATPSAAQTDVIGEWSRVASLPYFPVHTHMLPTGKVMIWPGDGGVSGNDPRSWDPADPFNVDPLNAGNAAHVTSLSKPGYDLFCSGHSFLADGTLFVAGGHISNNVGLSRASKYNPFTNAWSSPPLPNMNAGRWYPTTTVLANGDVLVVSGDRDLTIGVNTLPQVFQVATGTWRNLPQLGMDLYPQMLLAPNGRVFYAGPTRTTRYLDTSGTGAWTSVATRVGVFRSYGSAVMYAPGKVLVMGGGDPPTNTAEVIDLNQPSPSWRTVGSMASPRRQINATLLPDGNVLVTGGTSSSGFNNPAGAVHAAELWNPTTEQWTTLASSSGIPRVYHSAALLLPDGRVLSTGGNGVPQRDPEIYSPPYLFKGTRPTITSAPTSVAYGQSFVVQTDAAAISKIRMLRLSSVTHAFNMSQYINELSFSQTAGDLNVTAPPSGNVAPPGYYLLFILNGSGVPSDAEFVQLVGTAAPDTTPPTVSITAPAAGATVSGTAVTVSATAADNVGVAGVQFKLDGANLGAEDTSSPYSVTWNTTTTNNGSHTLTAVARDAAGNTAPSAGVSVTVNNAGPSCTLTPLNVSAATSDGGFAYRVNGSFGTPADNTANPTRSVLKLFENSLELGPAHSSHANIRTLGQGRFSHKSQPDGTGEALRFAASNNTNPRTNGRSYTYCVPGTAPDSTPPTVSITAPTSGATVSGTAVTVSATASDNVGVVGVQFKLDNTTNLGAEDTTSPYSVTWNTTTAANGSHTLTAVARDAVNTTTSAGVSVTVNNAAPSCTQIPLINVSAASSDGGFAYRVNGSFGTPADNTANPTRSVLKLFENSLELGPAHSSHANIRTLGQGRFSHKSQLDGTGEALRFAASNNTDPRTNGRSYTYCVPQ